MSYESNYYNDHRVKATEPNILKHNVTTHRMEAELENEDGELIPYSWPAKWDVCGTCNGKGTHVDPSIDCNGLTAEDFYEDPEFEYEYISGAYDQQCNECGGRTTVPMIDMERLNDTQKEALALLEREQDAEADSHAMERAERAMGA